MHEIIEFCGSYLYATEQALDAAIVATCEQMNAELVAIWAECFTRENATLLVHARLPDHASDAFRLSVLETLASTALQGAIEARRDGQTHEYYFVESVDARD